MRVEKNIEYAGFSVVLLKENPRSPYQVQLNSNINYRMCLPEALYKTGWVVDHVQFGKGKPVWTYPLTGNLQTVLMKEIYAIIETLYNTQRKLELEKLKKEREALFGADPDFEGD